MREQREGKMVGGDRLAGPQCEFGSEFADRSVKITLVQIDEPGVVMRFGELGIELNRGVEFVQGVRIVLLLRVGLAE